MADFDNDGLERSSCYPMAPSRCQHKDFYAKYREVFFQIKWKKDQLYKTRRKRLGTIKILEELPSEN